MEIATARAGRIPIELKLSPLIRSLRQYLDAAFDGSQRQQATRRNLIKPKLDGATSVSPMKEKTLLFRSQFRECTRTRASSVKSAPKNAGTNS